MVAHRTMRVRGYKLPDNTKYVGRGSRWGNPYVWDAAHLKPGRVLVADRAEAIARYRADLEAMPDDILAKHLAPLWGRNLACWCPLSEPCHADVLLLFVGTMGERGRRLRQLTHGHVMGNP